MKGPWRLMASEYQPDASSSIDGCLSGPGWDPPGFGTDTAGRWWLGLSGALQGEEGSLRVFLATAPHGSSPPAQRGVGDGGAALPVVLPLNLPLAEQPWTPLSVLQK